MRSRVVSGRLADGVVGHTVSPARRDVLVEAVVRDVQLAVLEPGAVRRSPLEALLRLSVPLDELVGETGPEALEVLLGLPVDGVVLDDRRAPELLRRRKRALLLQEPLDQGQGLRIRLGHRVVSLRVGLAAGMDTTASAAPLATAPAFSLPSSGEQMAPRRARGGALGRPRERSTSLFGNGAAGVLDRDRPHRSRARARRRLRRGGLLSAECERVTGRGCVARRRLRRDRLLDAHG